MAFKTPSLRERAERRASTLGELATPFVVTLSLAGAASLPACWGNPGGDDGFASDSDTGSTTADTTTTTTTTDGTATAGTGSASASSTATTTTASTSASSTTADPTEGTTDPSTGTTAGPTTDPSDGTTEDTSDTSASSGGEQVPESSCACRSDAGGPEGLLWLVALAPLLRTRRRRR